jgi:hypothetical protein
MSPKQKSESPALGPAFLSHSFHSSTGPEVVTESEVDVDSGPEVEADPVVEAEAVVDPEVDVEVDVDPGALDGATASVVVACSPSTSIVGPQAISASTDATVPARTPVIIERDAGPL